jgi:hypothetical protein
VTAGGGGGGEEGESGLGVVRTTRTSKHSKAVAKLACELQILSGLGDIPRSNVTQYHPRGGKDHQLQCRVHPMKVL